MSSYCVLIFFIFDFFSKKIVMALFHELLSASQNSLDPDQDQRSVRSYLGHNWPDWDRAHACLKCLCLSDSMYDIS